MRKRGRPAGGTDNRAAIVTAATTQFAENGYAGATMRSIAAAAGVDAALVYHYFGSKDRLFVEVAGLPMVPAEAIQHAIDGGVDGLGERLARMFIAAFGGPDGTGGPAVAVLRSATENPAAARMMREFVREQIIGRVATALELPDPDLRAALMGSQLIGLALARFVVGVEPIASMTTDEIVHWYGPVLQHYATVKGPGCPDW